jgi:hypothetical protein
MKSVLLHWRPLIISSRHERLHRFADLYLNKLEGTEPNFGGENVTVLNKTKDEVCLLPFNNILPSLVNLAGTKAPSTLPRANNVQALNLGFDSYPPGARCSGRRVWVPF